MRHNEVPRHLCELAARIAFDGENEGKVNDEQGNRPPGWDSLSDEDKDKRVKLMGYVLAAVSEETIGANVPRDPPQDIAVEQGRPGDKTGDADKSSGAQRVANEADAKKTPDQLKADKQFQAEADNAAAEGERNRVQATADENKKLAATATPLDKHTEDSAKTPAQAATDALKPKPSIAPLPNRDSTSRNESANSPKR